MMTTYTVVVETRQGPHCPSQYLLALWLTRVLLAQGFDLAGPVTVEEGASLSSPSTPS